MSKVYQISLLNFIFDKDDQTAVSHYCMRKDNGHLLSRIQTVIFLELPKIDALGNVPPENLHSEERWCKFMIDADNPYKQDYVRHLAEAEGGIMEAKKTLDSISTDWVLWKRELDRDVIESDRKTELLYMQEQGLEQRIQQGIQQGKQEGTAQAKREAAHNLKKLGVPVQTIAQAVGLSEEEITQL
jgi:predicted transposase/invertase (TIGR01784 family)